MFIDSSRSLIAGAVLAAALAASAIPQELPPGVLLVSRIKEHTRRQLVRMLDYTCLETVHRYRKEPARHWDPRVFDTLRLEVLFTGTKEMYSSPGDRHFSEEHPGAFTSMGFSQDGLFGIYLYNVLVSGLGQYFYRGEEDLDGRRSARYDFRVSSFSPPLTLSLGDKGEAKVGMKGTFWADPDSLDVLRLDVQGDDIPLTFPVVASKTTMRYAPVSIGGLDIMVAQSAESQLEFASGAAARNVVELTHCRSFAAQSSISYGAEQPAADAAPPPFSLPGADFASTSQTVPAGLRIAVALSQPVTGKTAVGTSIEGRVVGAVGAKGGPVEIPDGALVRGRFRRLERRADSGALLVALEFTDVETDGRRLRFYADLVSADRLSGVEPAVTAQPARPARSASKNAVAAAVEIPGMPDLPGVAYFLVHGESLEFPRGFITVWKTHSLTE